MASANMPSKPGQSSSFVKPLCFEQVTDSFWKRYECKCAGDCEVCGMTPAAEKELEPPSHKEGAGGGNSGYSGESDLWPFAHPDWKSKEPGLCCEPEQGEADNGKATDIEVNGPAIAINNYDPQANQFNSILNLDIEDEHEEDEPLVKVLEADLPDFNECPFDDKNGGCFKSRCFKTHQPPIDKRIQKEETTAQRGFHFQKLPKKHHPQGVEVSFHGYVTYARSPGEFYTLPETNFDCDCEMDLKATEFNPHRSDGKHGLTGKDGKHEVVYLLQQYMTKPGNEIFQTPVYLFGELVICSSTSYGVCRGVVLQNVRNDDDSEAVPVYLIDVGEAVRVPFYTLYTVPEDLTKTQPLVYKCSLFGVTPVGFEYSSRAKDFFHRLLVQNKHRVLVHVIGKGSRRLSMFREKRPYMVNLTVKFNQKHVRVAQILQDFGLAVQLNLTPFRPLVFKDLGHDMLTMTEYVLGEAKKPSSEQLKEICEKEVADWQRWEEGSGWKCKLSEKDVANIAQCDEGLREKQLKKVVETIEARSWKGTSSDVFNTYIQDMKSKYVFEEDDEEGK